MWSKKCRRRVGDLIFDESDRKVWLILILILRKSTKVLPDREKVKRVIDLPKNERTQKFKDYIEKSRRLNLDLKKAPPIPWQKSRGQKVVSDIKKSPRPRKTSLTKKPHQNPNFTHNTPLYRLNIKELTFVPAFWKITQNPFYFQIPSHFLLKTTNSWLCPLKSLHPL